MEPTYPHTDAQFYLEFLNDPDVWERLDTVEKLQEIIDQMEEYIPHDRMPPCYSQVVAKRNRLAVSTTKECEP